jgi:hypothetical protein
VLMISGFINHESPPYLFYPLQSYAFRGTNPLSLKNETAFLDVVLGTESFLSRSV